MQRSKPCVGTVTRLKLGEMRQEKLLFRFPYRWSELLKGNELYTHPRILVILCDGVGVAVRAGPPCAYYLWMCYSWFPPCFDSGFAFFSMSSVWFAYRCLVLYPIWSKNGLFWFRRLFSPGCSGCERRRKLTLSMRQRNGVDGRVKSDNALVSCSRNLSRWGEKQDPLP